MVLCNSTIQFVPLDSKEHPQHLSTSHLRQMYLINIQKKSKNNVFSEAKARPLCCW